MNNRKCPECGATFTPTNGRQVCCAPMCQKRRQQRLSKHWGRRARKVPDPRKAMLARLAARDAAYAREYGHPSGRPRGRLAAPLAPSLFPVEPGASTL